MNDLKIEYLPTNQLHPYDRNTRKHADYDVSQIMTSIQKYGFSDPIGVWGDKNTVVEGHGRLCAAKRLKMKTVPVIHLDHLTDEQRKEYAIIHNKTAELSEWDMDLLTGEINELDFSDFDIDWGLPEQSTDIEEVIEDEIPEVPQEPKSQMGQLYKLGNHRLLCGDSTKAADIDRLLNGKHCDMVFTDPPYGYNYQSNMRVKSDKFNVIENDDKILDFFPALSGRVDGFVYVCTTWKTADKWTELFKRHYDLTNVIIWDKGGGGIGDLFHTFATDYEMILVCNNGQELRGKRYGSVWNFTNTEITKMKKEELLKIVLEQKEYYSIWRQKKDNPNEYVHPTQKPVALPARAIRSSTDFNGTVLDLFGGSGSTLMACEQLGRKCFMMELDPKYVDVIIERWEKFTGKKAELI